MLSPSHICTAIQQQVTLNPIKILWVLHLSFFNVEIVQRASAYPISSVPCVNSVKKSKQNFHTFSNWWATFRRSCSSSRESNSKWASCQRRQKSGVCLQALSLIKLTFSSRNEVQTYAWIRSNKTQVLH